jgi:Bacterial archaeo-eukaryotic release factor family 10
MEQASSQTVFLEDRMTTSTQTAQPFLVQTLVQLERELPQDGVLTAIINLNPAHAQNDGPALETRVRNALRDLEIPPERTQDLLSRLRAAQFETGKTRAFFIWPGGGLVFRINLDLPDVIAFGKPALEPLRELVEAHPLTAIALVDHHWGRVFTLELGWLTERVRLENIPEGQGFRTLEPSGAVIPAPPRERAGEHGMDRNTDNDQIARTRANRDRLFAKTIAESLEDLRHTEAFRQLVVAGTDEGIATFKAELNHELNTALVGEYAQSTDAPAARVLEESLGVLELARVETNRRLLADALEHGTRGPLETLEGLQQGRVYHVLIAGDGSSLRLWRDTAGPSPYVFAAYPPQGQSPLSGQAVEGISLRDALPELRERFGLRVNTLTGEPARTLEREAGGLAGLIRYQKTR